MLLELVQLVRAISESVSGRPATVLTCLTPPAPQAAAALVSRDQKSGLITAGITGSEANQQTYAKDLSAQIVVCWDYSLRSVSEAQAAPVA